MRRAEEYTVMERFIRNVELVDRLWLELNNKRSLSHESSDLMNLLGEVCQTVGE